MSGTRSYDVIIAGGGFAGASLALALAEFAPRGFGITLVDAEGVSKGSADARASALTAASKGLLSVLGVWQGLAETAQPILSIDITDSALDAGRRPHFLGFDDAIEGGEAGAYLVENADLHRALGEALSKQRDIDVVAPDGVTDFASGPVGIEAKLASGASFEGKLLVAADGKRSRLRERAGIKCVSWSYPQIGIVATVAHTRPHEGKAVQHFLPAGPFAILPLKGNRCSIVWSEERAEGERIMAGSEAEFLVELGKRFGHQLGDISLAGPRQSFPLDLQIARSFVAPRFALLGDAAHAVHPLAGQGLNIGLRDVAALAEVIVDASRLGIDIGATAVLERYERWRRFDSAMQATAMDGLNRLFSNDSAPLRALRDIGLGVVDRTPWLKRVLVREAAGFGGNIPRLLKGERV